jgi:NhaA family Na+:H+ antiporter
MKNRLSRTFTEFFESEKTGGLVLVVCTALSLLIANSAYGERYLQFWQGYLDLSFLSIQLNYSLEHWINDGLMTLFFLLVGLEIERELYAGELADLRNAMLPIFAALGGMIIPALFHLSFTLGTPSQPGMGIPMATDIAFTLGVLALLGNKIPPSLKIFLAALAIIDDLGAVMIIALFYTQGFSLFFFAMAVIIFAALIVMNRLKINRLIFYLVPGIVLWYFMLRSGVHATTAGILLAFAVPFCRDEKFCPSYRLQHFLHKPVSFLILPVFAFANTGIVFAPDWFFVFTERNTGGILAGLVLGKPLGIFIFSLIAVKTGICKLPEDLSVRHIIGAGALAGIGFTMSMFITNLAFSDAKLITSSKIAILIASAVAGVTGFLVLFMAGKPSRTIIDNGG